MLRLRGVQIGVWCIPYRPVHVVGGWWSALGYFKGNDWLDRVYLPESEAMEWYDKCRTSTLPAVAPTPSSGQVRSCW